MALILTGIFGAFLALAGLIFFRNPQMAVGAFGIDASHMADLALAPVVGLRQIFFGVILIALALARQRVALGIVLLLGALVPVGDWLIAGQSLGNLAAVRQLLTLPVFLVLGVVLVRA